MLNLKIVNKIVKIFQEGNDMYDNHTKAADLLLALTNDKQNLFDIIKHNLNNPPFLNKTQTYCTLALDVVETPNVSLVVNIFPSLPDRNTETSFQSVHHHGYMLLTTTPAFGVGYKAITFNKDFVIDKKTKETKMSRYKVYNNTDSKIDFIDANTPHIVFYPKSISATYALWSKNTKKDVSNKLKKVSFILKFKKQIREVIEFFGLEKMVGIAKVEYYDFYPEGKKLYAMKDRIHYNPKAGTNEHFIQNIFYFIQQVGFNDVEFLKLIKERSSTPEFAKNIIQKVINGEILTDIFVPEYLNISKVNLKYEEVILATQ